MSYSPPGRTSRATVLYLLPQPFFQPRGSSFRALATLEAIAGLGYQVDLLCFPLGADPKDKAFTIFRSGKPPFFASVPVGPSPRKLVFDIPLAWSARRLVRANAYDVIHGVEEAGFIAGYLGRRYGVPYIFDMHSWMSQQLEDGNYLRSRFLLNRFKRLELRAMARARAIITVGPEMTEVLKRLAPGVAAYSLPDSPLSFGESATPELENTITRRFFSQTRRTILYTGNFHPYQGIDLLIQSIRQLKQRIDGRFDFVLLLVGGSAAESRTVGRYRKMASDLGLEQEIVFCGEYPAEAMPAFMRRSDLLVSSRISGNNVPLKVYTYLASGTLLVATNIPSHTQVLNDGNCLLADPEPEGLARALYRGLADISVQERERIATAARHIGAAEQHQAFKAIVQKCYEDCTRPPAATATPAPDTTVRSE